MYWTCCFDAFPLPTTAFLTSRGEYSASGRPPATAAGLAELQGRLSVLAVKGGLHGGLVGPVFLDDQEEGFVDQFQAFRHRAVGPVAHHPRGDQPRRAARELDDAVPRHQRAGVDAQDDRSP
jgi:hypothetical protein